MVLDENVRYEMCRRLVVPRYICVAVGGVRGPAVVDVLGEGRWPSVSETLLGQAGQEVGFFQLLQVSYV